MSPHSTQPDTAHILYTPYDITRAHTYILLSTILPPFPILSLPSVLFTVTGHFIYIDRIRHAASDPYYDVTPEDSDIIVHAVHPDSQRVLHGSELQG